MTETSVAKSLADMIEESGMVQGRTRCEIIAQELISNGVTVAKDTDVLTKIEVVVKEHADKDWPLPTYPATCGLRWIKGGECYGQYFGFDKPEIPTDDLVKAINELLKLPFKENNNVE